MLMVVLKNPDTLLNSLQKALSEHLDIFPSSATLTVGILLLHEEVPPQEASFLFRRT